MFVRHVGLASKEIEEVRNGDTVAVDHMVPPLAGEDFGIVTNLVGTARLTIDEIGQIKRFRDEHLSEHEAQKHLDLRRFVIRPHAKPLEDNGKAVCMRFSCVGFVIEAYRDAGIILLDTDEASLPSVTRETIGKAYPLVLRPFWAELNRENEWGLDDSDDGSWPVVLPGYLFHALNRDEAEIRGGAYKAQPGDELFPRVGHVEPSGARSTGHPRPA